MGRPIADAAQAQRAAENRREAREASIRLLGRVHGVTALRQDWGGTWRPMSGPCRLALDEDGSLVPTDDPGTDEENLALVADLTDHELLAALPARWRGWMSDAITATFPASRRLAQGVRRAPRRLP